MLLRQVVQQSEIVRIAYRFALRVTGQFSTTLITGVQHSLLNLIQGSLSPFMSAAYSHPHSSWVPYRISSWFRRLQKSLRKSELFGGELLIRYITYSRFTPRSPRMPACVVSWSSGALVTQI